MVPLHLTYLNLQFKSYKVLFFLTTFFYCSPINVAILSLFFLSYQGNTLFWFAYKNNFVFILMTLILMYFMIPSLSDSSMMFLMKLNSLFCLMFFLCKNILLIYIFFELAVFPIFLLLMAWGYQIERIQATFFMVGYTLFFSVPCMVSIVWMLNSGAKYFLNEFFLGTFPLFVLIFTFLVKIPLFSIHVWLPKAHVESPTSGSIFLAAILLKLGGYGSIIFLSSMNYNSTLSSGIFWVAFCGSCVSTFLCLTQVDVKAIIAYSSVVHMNFMLLFLILSPSNIMISIILMLSHALVSSVLFLKSGGIFYFSKSRKMTAVSLSSYTSSVFFILMMVFLLFNFNPPPTMGSLTEFFIFFTLFKWLNLSFILLILFGLMAAYFCIFLISCISSGKKTMFKSPKNNMNINLSSIFLFILNIFYFMLILL